MKLEVQAHLVLESKADFRLTSGLENAVNLESDVEYLPASLPSYLSGPPPLTAAGLCFIGTPNGPKTGSIGSVQLRRNWHPFSPPLTTEDTMIDLSELSPEQLVLLIAMA